MCFPLASINCKISQVMWYDVERFYNVQFCGFARLEPERCDTREIVFEGHCGINKDANLSRKGQRGQCEKLMALLFLFTDTRPQPKASRRSWVASVDLCYFLEEKKNLRLNYGWPHQWSLKSFYPHNIVSFSCWKFPAANSHNTDISSNVRVSHHSCLLSILKFLAHSESKSSIVNFNQAYYVIYGIFIDKISPGSNDSPQCVVE